MRSWPREIRAGRSAWTLARRHLAVAILVLSGALPGPARAGQDFASWLNDFRVEAGAKGISQRTLDRALGGLEPIPRVLELDQKQPEHVQTLWSYLDRAVTPERVERGRKLLAKHQPLLEDIERRYGIQPRFLVAIWGLESNFGSYTGGFSVVGALATLAHDGRRGDFFRAQLLDALRIIDQGHVAPERMTGSWAGAMGHVQFIPATFLRYAVDQDGDGRRDIWGSLPDAFGSAANYLRALSWRGDKTWGREVRLPADFDWGLTGLDGEKSLGEWQALGVRRADGRNLPRVAVEGAIILPAGHKGPGFLVYQNYHAILRWNRSLLYAVAIGHLADRIAGQGPLLAKRPSDDRPLSRLEVEEIQNRLLALGYHPGTPDGVLGSKTRAALKAYQRSNGEAADGYPTAGLLERLRRASGG